MNLGCLAKYFLAFGAFARTLPAKEEYSSLHRVTAGIELCDSLALDGHKLLNVVSSPACRIPTLQIDKQAVAL